MTTGKYERARRPASFLSAANSSITSHWVTASLSQQSGHTQGVNEVWAAYYRASLSHMLKRDYCSAAICLAEVLLTCFRFICLFYSQWWFTLMTNTHLIRSFWPETSLCFWVLDRKLKQTIIITRKREKGAAGARGERGRPRSLLKYGVTAEKTHTEGDTSQACRERMRESDVPPEDKETWTLSWDWKVWKHPCDALVLNNENLSGRVTQEELWSRGRRRYLNTGDVAQISPVRKKHSVSFHCS